MYRNNSPNEGMSLKQWLGTFLLLIIPVVNVIAFFVWLFGGGKNRTRINFVRASLIFALIIGILSTLVFFFFLEQLKSVIEDNMPTFQHLIAQHITL